MDDDAIRSLVTRLARPRPGGGATIERAAILAEGADFDAVMTWIVAHGAEAQAATKSSSRHGLHGYSIVRYERKICRSIPCRGSAPCNLLKKDSKIFGPYLIYFTQLGARGDLKSIKYSS